MITNIPNIVFSDEAKDIIYSLLKKYNLYESREVILKKIKERKARNHNLLANLAAKRFEEEMSSDLLVSELEKSFNLTKKQASALTKEIENKIIPLAQYENTEEMVSGQKKTINILRPTAGEKTTDVYREPVE